MLKWNVKMQLWIWLNHSLSPSIQFLICWSSSGPQSSDACILTAGTSEDLKYVRIYYNGVRGLEYAVHGFCRKCLLPTGCYESELFPFNIKNTCRSRRRIVCRTVTWHMDWSGHLSVPISVWKDFTRNVQKCVTCYYVTMTSLQRYKDEQVATLEAEDGWRHHGVFTIHSNIKQQHVGFWQVAYYQYKKCFHFIWLVWLIEKVAVQGANKSDKPATYSVTTIHNVDLKGNITSQQLIEHNWMILTFLCNFCWSDLGQNPHSAF